MKLVLVAICLPLVVASTAADERPTKQFAVPLRRFADPLPSPPRVPFQGGKFSLRAGKVVVFTGPANVVFEQQHGWLETLLTAGAREQRPTFRPLGWEGDTVYEQWRAMNFSGNSFGSLSAQSASATMAKLIGQPGVSSIWASQECR
jgi:hypothetical protein